MILGPVTRVISGGQTGADRAALDWALYFGLPVGGWCPAGRQSEDGTIPDWYPLRATPKSDYRQRTEWNVRDSDATVIFTPTSERGRGSDITARLASTMGRPWLHLYGSEGYGPGTTLASWLVSLRRGGVTPEDRLVLNVAGTRQSTAPGIVGFVHEVLRVAAHAMTDGINAGMSRGWEGIRDGVES
jgi:hypothetical protein